MKKILLIASLLIFLINPFSVFAETLTLSPDTYDCTVDSGAITITGGGTGYRLSRYLTSDGSFLGYRSETNQVTISYASLCTGSGYWSADGGYGPMVNGENYTIVSRIASGDGPLSSCGGAGDNLATCQGGSRYLGEDILITDDAPILGCTDPEAENYDPSAEEDDGSCTYPPVITFLSNATSTPEQIQQGVFAITLTGGILIFLITFFGMIFYFKK